MIIYSTSQAAAYLGITNWILKALHKRGVVMPSCITRGGHRRYLLSELQALKKRMTAVQDRDLVTEFEAKK
jgi:DNA-binding transcriptional MerR regulator